MPAYAMAFDNPVLNDDPSIPWHISADELEYHQQSKQYIATGNVTITKGNKKLTADRVRFDHNTMNALAEGHVMMTSGADILTGERIEIDLKNETGTLFGGSIFIKENHFYIQGDKIQKIGKNEYAAYQATLSTCDGDIPAWRITGRKINVTVEGYGVVSHAAFWANRIPLMYVPMMIFPVKLKRQSGLLLPWLGYSEQNGAEIEQPFYWAINKNSDATVYDHYIQERGNKIGLEYRYVFDKNSKGTLMYDYLKDRKYEESSRYWFRMKHDQAMPSGIFAKIDIDILSDQDYLHEFRDGYTGFDKTEAYFYKNFARRTDDYSDPIRVNSLNLNKRWNNYSLNGGVRWYDDVALRQSEEPDTTLHKLPFLRLDSLKQPLTKYLPLYWRVDSEYTHFHREEGTTGDRIDIYPRISLLKQVRNYLTIEPSVGFRGTLWNVNHEDTALSEDSTRGIYDLKAEVSSNLFRVYPLSREKTGILKKLGLVQENADKVKHIIKPRITYEYVPEENQDDYPSFDYLDRIEKRHRITCSITNTVVTRSDASLFEPGSEDETKQILYQPVCRFKLSQSYDISDPGVRDLALENQTDDRHSFSPIFGEFQLTPSDFVSVQADTKWSPYDVAFQSRNFSFNLSDRRGDRLFVEYRYNQNISESFFTDMTIKLSDRWLTYADYERNLNDGEDIRTRMGVLYQAACWSADLAYTNENHDRRYAFVINLKGLGGIGSN